MKVRCGRKDGSPLAKTAPVDSATLAPFSMLSPQLSFLRTVAGRSCFHPQSPLVPRPPFAPVYHSKQCYLDPSGLLTPRFSHMYLIFRLDFCSICFALNSGPIGSTSSYRSPRHTDRCHSAARAFPPNVRWEGYGGGVGKCVL